MTRARIPAPEGMKHCTKCDEDWPADLEFFYSDPTAHDGLYYCCKACYREWLAVSPRRLQLASAQPHASDSIASLLAGPLSMGRVQ